MNGLAVDAFDVEANGGGFLDEGVHEDEEDLFFGGEVLIEATNGDACLMGDIFDGGSFVAALGEEGEGRLQERMSFAAAALLLWWRRKVLPGQEVGACAGAAGVARLRWW